MDAKSDSTSAFSRDLIAIREEFEGPIPRPDSPGVRLAAIGQLRREGTLTGVGLSYFDLGTEVSAPPAPATPVSEELSDWIESLRYLLLEDVIRVFSSAELAGVADGPQFMLTTSPTFAASPAEARTTDAAFVLDGQMVPGWQSDTPALVRRAVVLGQACVGVHLPRRLIGNAIPRLTIH